MGHSFHGTSEQALAFILNRGFHPPADFECHCPQTQYLSTQKANPICDVSCALCSVHEHTWNKCHMFGFVLFDSAAGERSILMAAPSEHGWRVRVYCSLGTYFAKVLRKCDSFAPENAVSAACVCHCHREPSAI